MTAQGPYFVVNNVDMSAPFYMVPRTHGQSASWVLRGGSKMARRAPAFGLDAGGLATQRTPHAQGMRCCTLGAHGRWDPLQ